MLILRFRGKLQASSNVIHGIILLLSLIFLLLLTLLPFYDQSNLITVLWISSHFYSFKPPFSNVGWPGGPFFLLVWIPSYSAYILSGFQLFFAYFVLKVILLFLSLGTGFILSNFFSKDIRFKVLIFIILNPALVFVTLIWMQFDIIPVFFFTFSMYFLDKPHLNDSFYGTLIAVVLMFIAIFTVYYPLIFIPTLIIFSKNHKQKIYLLSNFLLVGLSFSISDILFFRGTNFSYVVNLAGNGLSSSFYEGLQYFFNIPFFYYILFVATIMILIPFFLHKKGYGLYTSSFILLLVFLYTSASAGFDTYLWLLPFTVLAIFERKKGEIRISHMFMLNIPIFLEALFSNFIMGTGFQQGIFYFGYEVFHINYLFIRTASQFQYFVTLFNSLLMTSIVTILILLLLINKPDNLKSNRDIVPKNEQTYFVSNGKVKSGKNSFSPWYRLFVVILVALVVSVPISFIFNQTYTNINNSNINSPPIGIFFPSFTQNSGNFAMSVNNLTYINEHNKTIIYPQSPSLGFYRDLGGQLLNLNLSVYLSGNSSGSMNSVINSSLFGMQYDSIQSLNISNYSFTPSTMNDIKYSMVDTGIIAKPVKVTNFNGSNAIIYTLNDTFLNYYHLIAFKQNNSTASYHYLWFASNSNETAGVSMILLNNDLATVSYGNKSLSISYPKISYNRWSYVLFKISNSSLVFYINGQKEQIASNFFRENNIFSNGSIFRISYANNESLPYNFRGDASPLYSASTPNFVRSESYYISTRDSIKQVKVNNISNQINLSILDSSNNTSLSLNGHKYFFQGRLLYLTFGKLTPGYWGLTIIFHNISLRSTFVAGYYLVPIFYFSSLPFLIIPVSVVYSGKKNYWSKVLR
ncbi:MAG: hypothetical protein ACYCSO_06905 [Cuniculiplasma sp.]